ncbi:carbohydrate-binding module family 18 protein [Dichotomopilus funicola]|uniref:Carbohydrate-binding module family 18 protein n=1 Tax=Dichotomopilus funicola TaxID=1934379 RepID=A0AAN6ZPF8_9PEZI|nr:carbohydrate-binding module family 18 protein [Dichotomopilus funicola]
MATSLLTNILFLLAISHPVTAACTRTVTAAEGDTCATLASQAGITVTEFLKQNPDVKTCSSLVPGTEYCVEGTVDDTTTSTGIPTATATDGGSPAPSDPLEVSKDGNCGDGFTCEGSTYGNCCSVNGYCGSSADYCGEGCQVGFGTCGDDGGEDPPTGSVTITVTETQTETETTTIISTTAPGSIPATATATETETETETQTATVTETETDTIPGTATETSTAIITSIRTSTSVATITSIDTITDIVTSTEVVTSGCETEPPTQTTSSPPEETTTPPATGPSLPLTPDDCANLDVIGSTDTCETMASRNGISVQEL